MRASQLAELLLDLEGDPIVALRHPGVMGAVTPSIQIHKAKAGKNKHVPESNFPTLHLQQYYPTAVEKVQDVVVLDIWPHL